MQLLHYVCKKTTMKKNINHATYKMKIFEELVVEKEFEMPIIKVYDGEKPERLMSFNKAIAKKQYDATVHFYINDKEFTRILTYPEKYLEILKRFKSVIAPDFSQYIEMPYPMRLYHCYLNKAFAAYWSKNGINVIPNVTWSTPDSYDYSFAGIEKNGIIAINCTGVKKSAYSKFLWLEGYKEAIKRLEPRHIIRYGEKMPGEFEKISTYFENENYKLLNNGRKR